MLLTKVVELHSGKGVVYLVHRNNCLGNQPRLHEVIVLQQSEALLQYGKAA